MDNFQSQTAEELAQTLGEHLRDLRLRRNRTQFEVANVAQISLTALRNLESGRGTLHTMIAVLRCLDRDALQSMLGLIAPPSVSAMQVLKLQGKKRERAGTPRAKRKHTSEQQLEPAMSAKDRMERIQKGMELARDNFWKQAVATNQIVVVEQDGEIVELPARETKLGQSYLEPKDS
jgi:transcriptional regulator with XRE-family HTH domain